MGASLGWKVLRSLTIGMESPGHLSLSLETPMHPLTAVSTYFVSLPILHNTFVHCRFHIAEGFIKPQQITRPNTQTGH